jgi:hypothetical protein
MPFLISSHFVKGFVFALVLGLPAAGFRVEVVLEAHLSLAIFRDVSFACNSRRSI